MHPKDSKSSEASDKARNAQGVVSACIALVQELAGAHQKDFESLKHHAQDLAAAYAQIPNQRQHKQGWERVRSVDAWILDIFSATERAIPRETLVEEFLTGYPQRAPDR